MILSTLVSTLLRCCVHDDPKFCADKVLDCSSKPEHLGSLGSLGSAQGRGLKRRSSGLELRQLLIALLALELAQVPLERWWSGTREAPIL